MSLEDAIARVKTFIGTRYDSQVVAALCEACETGQISPGRVRLSRRTQELSKVPRLQNAVQSQPASVPNQPATA